MGERPSTSSHVSLPTRSATSPPRLMSHGHPRSAPQMQASTTLATA